MGWQRGLRFDRCTVAPRGACILHRCLARKQAASWRFWGGCLGALATGVVPLTFDNNVDVASYYLLALRDCAYLPCALYTRQNSSLQTRDLLVERLATYTLLAASYDEMAWPRANIDDVCSVI